MPAPDGTVSVRELRDAARQMVDVSSLRAVAREVGISPMGLRHFLEGGRPQFSTRLKLEEWWRRGHAESTVRELLELVLLQMPKNTLDEDVAAFLVLLAETYRRRGIPPPPWLEGLRREHEDFDE